MSAPTPPTHANTGTRLIVTGFATTGPFHGNAGWRWVRDNDPDGWTEEVEFDRAIRHSGPHATTQGQMLRG